MSLTSTGRALVLTCAFLGWLCAGFHLATTQLIGRTAAQDLLNRTGAIELTRFDALSKQKASGSISDSDATQLAAWQALVGQWFAWYQCAFLFGAATGGLAFGRLGDKIGRAKAMSASILTYSGMAAVACFATTPTQLLLAWFLACTGVGGMWPNGVALLSEAWSGLSRTVVSGLIGTSANVGIFIITSIATKKQVVPGDWQWVLMIGASPFLLGLFSLFFVPESPRWLAARRAAADASTPPAANWEVFRPPLLQVTLVGILLGTIPMIGGWGSANWMIPWADQAVEGAATPNPFLKAQVGQARAFTGIIGSLIGGWVASIVGRRRTYFLISIVCLVIAQWTFWKVVPTDATFLYWVSALGFFSGLYFGWLPLCLPELFPIRVRSTGAGVSFNFGRILTAVTVFASGLLIESFSGDYAAIGRVTSLIFALGMVAIALAPDTTQRSLDE
ncbi:MAG: MFS transporter [Planctomycetaceae bacterium]|nr:MFS transporter [Planctomycetaceae bacterium]